MAAHMIGGNGGREREGGRQGCPILWSPIPRPCIPGSWERPPHPPGPQVVDREMATRQDKTRQ